MKKKLINNKGMTMTEILVAFLLLLLCLLMLVNCMSLASNLIKKSKDLDDAHTSVQKMLATESGTDSQTGSIIYNFSDFNLTVGTQNTVYSGDSSISAADKTYKTFTEAS
jgi:Tfp pilus assembly protein PilV